eukprot:1232856-Rhodomonas_salina.1
MPEPHALEPWLHSPARGRRRCPHSSTRGGLRAAAPAAPLESHRRGHAAPHGGAAEEMQAARALGLARQRHRRRGSDVRGGGAGKADGADASGPAHELGGERGAGRAGVGAGGDEAHAHAPRPRGELRAQRGPGRPPRSHRPPPLPPLPRPHRPLPSRSPSALARRGLTEGARRDRAGVGVEGGGAAGPQLRPHRPQPLLLLLRLPQPALPPRVPLAPGAAAGGGVREGGERAGGARGGGRA